MFKSILNKILKKYYLFGDNEVIILDYLSNFSNSLVNPRKYYLFCYKYFHRYLVNELVLHRRFFQTDKRGFGEDAFHVMWYLIFKKYRPKTILEVGVYRGQTLSLFSLLSHKLNINSEIHGISPFTSSGDKVSKYLEGLNYYVDVLKNFNDFSLPTPNLHKGFSNEFIMKKVIDSKPWDLIYIDGNHDYEIVKQDFTNCSLNLKSGGLIVLDDSALYTAYKPYSFSTAGHPGPSKIAQEIDRKLFKEMLSVGHNRVFKRI